MKDYKNGLKSYKTKIKEEQRVLSRKYIHV
jgi:hypothetical protein